MDDIERAKEIEFYKNNLNSKQRELYDICKEFWQTEEGKKAIMIARQRKES